jgi:DNA-binding NtrC family response regulator
MTLRLPPLRERLADLPDLTQHVLARLKPPRLIHMDALGVLARYDWPGNVRELDNVLQAAALLSDDHVLGPAIVEQALASRRRSRAAPSPRLAPRAEAVLRLLRGGWRSAPHVAERLGVSTRTVNRELQQLSHRGLVETCGEARARRYRARRDSSRDAPR